MGPPREPPDSEVDDGAPRDAEVSRAAGKLRAALALFDLGKRVRAQIAVDVGASTGGFTETLLAAGATKVVAVDVGHDQLHSRLRDDPRVESHERVDWKTLSLSELPGPFGFFTVDVSFVAARNMLRSLAFRLRAGAEGVVLVKPQFELPKEKARMERLSEPALRQEALDLFSVKADSLGFDVLAHADSPVAGREGTVEILTHLRFRGRSERLPLPGEKKTPSAPPLRPKRKRSSEAGTSLSDEQAFFAVVPPGLEEILAVELAARGVSGTAETGGVSWRGSWEGALNVNLWSRLATRVLARVAEGAEAESFAVFRRRVSRMPWERFLTPERRLRANISVSRSRLYHTGALAEQLWLGIGDRLGKPPAVATSAEDAEQLLVVRGEENHFTFSVDTSGEPLHRRGWREEGGAAPLRETLAAAMLALCGWQPTEAVFDPVCGSGTLVLEAASAAIGLAPGLRRSFAFEAFPAFAKLQPRWSELRATVEVSHQRTAEALRATSASPLFSPLFVGRDVDPATIALAQRNAERAGLAAFVSFAAGPLVEARPPHATGLLLANPPYGYRLGTPGAARATYRELGRLLRQEFAGWRAGVLVPDAAAAQALGTGAGASFPLKNGGLKLDLLRFDVPRSAARLAPGLARPARRPHSSRSSRAGGNPRGPRSPRRDER